MITKVETCLSLGIFVVTAGALLASCGQAPVDSLEKGRLELARMSDALAGTASFTFSTAEEHVRPGRGPEPVTRSVSRRIAIRRPDGVWFQATGDREGQVWYDGAAVTLVSDKEQVWARVPLPETIDQALDELSIRYALPMPMADLLYSSPYDAFWTDDTTGGWVGSEEIDGLTCHHLSFQHEAVDWELWVAEDASALPCRLAIVYKQAPGEMRSTITFSDWQLAADLEDDRFSAEVPEDYERIGMVERLTPEELAKIQQAAQGSGDASPADAPPSDQEPDPATDDEETER